MVLKKSSDLAEEKNINIPTKHLFLPSGKFWWEIRSKSDEKSYFIDSSAEFCSCKGYYFNFKRNNGCYHLAKITEYDSSGDYVIKKYHDEDYSDFAKKIVIDAINEVRRTSNI